MQHRHDMREVGYFNPHTLKWAHVSWLILYEPRCTEYRKSTKGYYYHTSWHPVAVGQDAYVVDDFGQLICVHKEPVR